MRISPFYLILVVLIHQHHILLASPIEDNEPSSECQKQCESHTLETVEPFLAHFRKINDQLEKCENKDIEIKDLNVKLESFRLESNYKDKELQDLKEKFAQLEEKNLIQGEKLAQQEKDLSVSEIKIQDKEETITNLKSQISFNQQTIETLLTKSKPTNKCDQLEKQLSDKSEQLEGCMSQIDRVRDSCREEKYEENERKDELLRQLNNAQNNRTQTQENLELCQIEVKILNDISEDSDENSCIRFRHTPGKHKINIDELGATEVLCDSETVGDGYGWIVIQQRINGKEDFYRNWTTYRNGFGSFKGDFFIGLEKLHYLTNNQKQMLYIHMEDFNGTIHNAIFNTFEVASERQNYALYRLEGFSSSGVNDGFTYHRGMEFSTYDRDNDRWADDNCAVQRHGGWWYNRCALSNLNGKYSETKKEGYATVFWSDLQALKVVKMLIRPQNK